MCAFSNWLSKIFRIKTLTIPHPEEDKDDLQTIENTDIGATLSQWLEIWEVPVKYHEFWLTKIVIKLYDVWDSEMLAKGIQMDTPACAWEVNGQRYLASLAKWFNPGVIAHEQAHNSFALLTGDQKVEFSKVYTPLKTTDPLIKFLYSKNSYGLTSDIEGHADCYRYLEQSLPSVLKVYYPKLF